MVDYRTLGLLGFVLLLLGAATAAVHIIGTRGAGGIDAALLRTFQRRIRAWWLLFSLVALSFAGTLATTILFGLISFWALREFITVTPTRPGDHRALFWVFFLCTPLQFVLVSLGASWYGLYSIVIPVYAFLLVPMRVAVSDDPKRFLERVAKIQAGLMICVYCLSFAPALMTLKLPPRGSTTGGLDDVLHPTSASDSATRSRDAALPTGRGDSSAGADGVDGDTRSDAATNPDAETGLADGSTASAALRSGTSRNARLLLFFVLIVQLSDALQYAWSQLPSRHVVAPAISPGRTWEGLLGGTASMALLGAVLWWATPFPYWLAGLMSIVVSLMCFAGGMTMSAMKRDRGVKDFGTLVEGHGGVLDRIDSLCFSAPVFFHMVRQFAG